MSLNWMQFEYFKIFQILNRSGTEKEIVKSALKHIFWIISKLFSKALSVKCKNLSSVAVAKRKYLNRLTQSLMR
jgi:hypothetical protein